MPPYQRAPLPAYKPCTSTFIYSINIKPKVAVKFPKKSILRSNSVYNMYTLKK